MDVARGRHRNGIPEPGGSADDVITVEDWAMSMIRTIAVGLGGAGGTTALAWAADEAARCGARLLLLRVSPSCSPLARFTGDPPHERLELVDPRLARIVAAACHAGVEERVLRIVVGEPGPALAQAARTADLLVIGSGGRGNTVREVVRHARIPVVVARGTPGGRGSTFADHVVVGVDGAAAGRAALDFAFCYADRHDLPVAAAYVAASGPAGFDPAAADRLRAEVAPWSAQHPRTRVRRTVLHDHVADGLLRAGLGAHLLVVGNRHHGAVPRTRTTDVPGAVARTADCPVAVIPINHREGTPT
jgi:nucleotide-binding universal stress UspA family protein